MKDMITTWKLLTTSIEIGPKMLVKHEGYLSNCIVDLVEIYAKMEIPMYSINATYLQWGSFKKGVTIWSAFRVKLCAYESILS